MIRKRTLIVGWMVFMVGWLVFAMGWLRAQRPVESPRPPSNPGLVQPLVQPLAQHDSQRDLYMEESAAVGLTVGYVAKMGVKPDTLEAYTKAAIGLHHALGQGQLSAVMIMHAARNGEQHTMAALGIEIAKDTNGDYMESKSETIKKVFSIAEKGWDDLASQLGPDYTLDGIIHRLCQKLESDITLAQQQYGFDRKTAAGVVWRQWLKDRMPTADPEQRAAMQQLMVDP